MGPQLSKPQGTSDGGLASVLFTFLWLWKNERQEQLQAGRVYLGSQFEGAVHHGEEGMAAGAGGTMVRRQRDMDAGTQLTLSFLIN